MTIGAPGETNFRSENHTKLLKLLVSVSIPKFGRSTLQIYTNFGIGTLARYIRIATERANNGEIVSLRHSESASP